MSEKFSFRWGIPLLDAGDTRIPNFFFDRYIEAGVTRTEFLTILHLARYQFEKPSAECRPSMETVAVQMGYTVRGLRKKFAAMEKKGLLQRLYRPGKTTLYDFSGFSKRVMELELSTPRNPSSDLKVIHTPEPQFRPTPEPQFRPPRNPSSAEEEQQKEQSINDDDGWTPEQRQALKILSDNGADATRTVKAVAQQRNLEDIEKMIAAAKRKPGLSNPIGWAIARLRDGEEPPTVAARGDDRQKYISGEYADLIQT